MPLCKYYPPFNTLNPSRLARSQRETPINCHQHLQQHLRHPAPSPNFSFSLHILRTTAESTNSYGKLNDDGKERKWKEVSVMCVRAFIGITIYIGIFLSPKLEDDWNDRRNSRGYEIAKAMSLRQIQQVKLRLCIWDPSDDSGKSFFLNKVEPALQHAVNTSKHLWTSSCNVLMNGRMDMNYD